MEPVPTSFHLGPFTFHTYGFGLAIAFYVAYRYAEYRFAKRGLSVEKFGWFTLTVIVLGLLGARIAHVATNWAYYQSHPADLVAVWQGGLSSFGGLALAVPVGYLLARRWWPDTPLLAFTDALIPALLLGWSLGRFLGPQFMVGGGGHLTHQWFGLRYAGQVGKRIPVPLVQGLEDGALWLALIYIERRRQGRLPRGLVTGVGLVVWGIVRSTDEKLFLGQESASGSIGVQIAGIVLALIGVMVLVGVARQRRTHVPN